MFYLYLSIGSPSQNLMALHLFFRLPNLFSCSTKLWFTARGFFLAIAFKILIMIIKVIFLAWFSARSVALVVCSSIYLWVICHHYLVGNILLLLTGVQSGETFGSIYFVFARLVHCSSLNASFLAEKISGGKKIGQKKFLAKNIFRQKNNFWQLGGGSWQLGSGSWQVAGGSQ